MTAVVALALSCAALVVVIVFDQWTFNRERQAWAVERRELVNRAIARHAGEVRALDQRPVKPGPLDNPLERPTPVGL